MNNTNVHHTNIQAGVDPRIHKEQIRREKAVETIHEMREGHLPENKELIEGLDRLQLHVEENKRNLSKTGQQVALDVENILANTKELIESKNEGEHLQNAYYHLFKAGGAANIHMTPLEQLKAMISPAERDKLRDQAREGVHSMITIVRLMFISEEFRQFSNDFFTFFGDLLQKQSKKIEEKSHEEQRSFFNEENALDDQSTKQYEDPQPLFTDLLSDDSYKWIEQPGGTFAYVPVGDLQSVDSSFSHEKEEEFITRMVSLLNTLHKFPEYRNSIDFLAQCFSELNKTFEENLPEINPREQLPTETLHHQRETRKELIMFFDNWIGNGYSIEEFLCALRKFRGTVENDPELLKLFQDLRTFFTKSAQDTQYVENQEKVREDARDLVRRSRFLLKVKYREEFVAVKREALFLNQSIQRDNTLLRLRDNVEALMHHLLTDKQGNPVLKPELIHDAQFILKSLFESFKYIPLPPIERSDASGTFRLENVVINCGDIMPGQIQAFTAIDPAHPQVSCLEFKILRVRAHIRNAKFEIHKRTGFPKINETGFADVDIWGPRGMTIVFGVRPERPNVQNSLFHLKGVFCQIDKLNLRLKDTKHDGMYRFLAPFINRKAKEQMEVAIATYLAKFIVQLNHRAAETATRLADAAKETTQNQMQKLAGENVASENNPASHSAHTNPTDAVPKYHPHPPLF